MPPRGTSPQRLLRDGQGHRRCRLPDDGRTEASAEVLNEEPTDTQKETYF